MTGRSDTFHMIPVTQTNRFEPRKRWDEVKSIIRKLFQLNIHFLATLSCAGPLLFLLDSSLLLSFTTGKGCYTQLNTYPICAPETVAAVPQQRVKTEQMDTRWSAVSPSGLKMPQKCKDDLKFLRENNVLTAWWKTNSEILIPQKVKIS